MLALKGVSLPKPPSEGYSLNVIIVGLSTINPDEEKLLDQATAVAATGLEPLISLVEELFGKRSIILKVEADVEPGNKII